MNRAAKVAARTAVAHCPTRWRSLGHRGQNGAVATQFEAGVERFTRRRHEFLVRQRVVGEGGDPDSHAQVQQLARAEVEPPSPDVEANAFRDDACSVARGLGQYDDEPERFVEPRSIHGTEVTPDGFGHFPENFGAAEFPIAVRDPVHVVGADDDQAHAMLVSSCTLELEVERIYLPTAEQLALECRVRPKFADLRERKAESFVARVDIPAKVGGGQRSSADGRAEEDLRPVIVVNESSVVVLERDVRDKDADRKQPAVLPTHEIRGEDGGADNEELGVAAVPAVDEEARRDGKQQDDASDKGVGNRARC